jgi:hypothetical protein
VILLFPTDTSLVSVGKFAFFSSCYQYGRW